MYTKIATCCYCGTRAALVLEGGRHELSCGTCGAPLHLMKAMPVSSQVQSPVSGAQAVKIAPGTEKRRKNKVKKSKERADLTPSFGLMGKPAKGRKMSGKKLLGKLWEAVEDVFD